MDALPHTQPMKERSKFSGTDQWKNHFFSRMYFMFSEVNIPLLGRRSIVNEPLLLTNEKSLFSGIDQSDLGCALHVLISLSYMQQHSAIRRRFVDKWAVTLDQWEVSIALNWPTRALLNTSPQLRCNIEDQLLGGGLLTNELPISTNEKSLFSGIYQSEHCFTSAQLRCNIEDQLLGGA